MRDITPQIIYPFMLANCGFPDPYPTLVGLLTFRFDLLLDYEQSLIFLMVTRTRAKSLRERSAREKKSHEERVRTRASPRAK